MENHLIILGKNKFQVKNMFNENLVVAIAKTKQFSTRCRSDQRNYFFKQTFSVIHLKFHCLLIDIIIIERVSELQKVNSSNLDYWAMVLLHVKRGENSQFLYETTVSIDVGKLTQEIVAIYNGRMKIQRICAGLQ